MNSDYDSDSNVLQPHLTFAEHAGDLVLALIVVGHVLDAADIVVVIDAAPGAPDGTVQPEVVIKLGLRGVPMEKPKISSCDAFESRGQPALSSLVHLALAHLAQSNAVLPSKGCCRSTWFSSPTRVGNSAQGAEH